MFLLVYDVIIQTYLTPISYTYTGFYNFVNYHTELIHLPMCIIQIM